MRSLLINTILFLLVFQLYGQQGISLNHDGSSPDPSAILDMQSTEKGFLCPTITEAQKNAINNPAISLLVFQTDGSVPGFYYYSCYGWQHLGTVPTGSGCAMVASTTVDNNVSVYGASDGQATVTQSCGTLPITYLWSDNQTAQTASGLSAGNYCFTLTDADSCTFTECGITITEPAGLSYALGDTGPGGGIVFYIAPTPTPNSFGTPKAFNILISSSIE